jgi:hypothetical protein
MATPLGPSEVTTAPGSPPARSLAAPATWFAGRRVTPQGVVSAVAVGAAMLFVFWQLHPALLFANTTPAGGDMGAHVWLPAYLRDHLIPHGRLTGWTPDWYAGFPALTFYFPVPSLLIVLLDVVLPYGIAFKLISVAGVIALPLAAWGFGRLAGMRFPGPPCLAVATLPFLFERSFTIYGGNIPSTLAGEFAFSISLAFALVFLGVVARGLDTGKHRALAAGLLAATALCHVIPTFFAVGGAVVMLVFRPDRRRFWWLATAGLTGALLAAFWSFPFFARLAYTNDMGWEKLVTYRKNLFPGSLQWLLVIAAAGALAAIFRRRRTGTTLTLLAAGSALAFIVAPQSRLWNARILPFWFLCLYLLAGVALAELAHFIDDVREWRGTSIAATASGRMDGTVPSGNRRLDRPAEVLAPLAAFLVAATFVALPLQALPKWFPISTKDHSFIPDWVKWNYSGYERKPAYPEYQDLIAKMRSVGQNVGCGRAMWEYESQLDRLGTPMALMLLPHWTDGCIGSMEGLYFESAATTPYHFLNAAEMSKAPSNPQRDLPYGSLDVRKGVRHMQMLGVRYYMTFSDEAKAQARTIPDLRYLSSSGPWNVNYDDGVKERTWDIYEISGSELVAGLDHEPAVLARPPATAKGWLAMSTKWYLDEGRWSVPLAAGGPKSWPRAASGGFAPEKPVRAAVVSNIRTDDDDISFDVDQPGTPVVVKASYFPNWTASGADGPWRITPNLMVVVPTSKHVRLHYGFTPVDDIGMLLTLFGIAAVVVMARRRPLDYPVDDEPEADVDATEPDDPRPSNPELVEART